MRSSPYEEGGCKQFTVPADQLERRVLDLILDERGSEGFAEKLHSLVVEENDHRSQAARRVRDGERRIAELERKRTRTVELQIEVEDRGIPAEAYFAKLEEIGRQLEHAREELEHARRLSDRAEQTWVETTGVIAETRSLGAIWDGLATEEKRRVVNWWVDAVAIDAQLPDGRKRKSEVHLEVMLKTTPYSPKRAWVSSSRTQASSSTSKAPESTSRASMVPIRPKAHAEWPRINGSESNNALESTGTDSGEPQFPNATATLRSSPLRFVRFTGEPLKRLENSSWESPISSTSFAPCTPSRGQNASSEVICTNFGELWGHTSLQMSQP
jgi:hypothetical protein